MGKHGGKPPYPLAYDKNGMVRKDSLHGGQSLREHLLTGRPACGGADIFYHLDIKNSGISAVFYL